MFPRATSGQANLDFMRQSQSESEQFLSFLMVEENHQVLAVKGERNPTGIMEPNPGCRSQESNPAHSSKSRTCYQDSLEVYCTAGVRP